MSFLQDRDLEHAAINPLADPRIVVEIYLADPGVVILDGNPVLTHPTRLTENTGGSNSYAAVSPNGKKIVFETTDFEPRKSRC